MSGTLVERTSAYVAGHPLLRVLVALTFLNYAGSVALAARGELTWEFAGYLAILSILTWFFGVLLPMMNRGIRERFGQDPVGYWGGVVEIFARVVLCVQTGLYSALLTSRALGIDG